MAHKHVLYHSAAREKVLQGASALADLAEVVDLMLEHKIGAVPVTNADGALVGIISYLDVLRALPIAS